MRAKTKKRLYLAGVCLGLLLIVYAALVLVDGDPPDDSDLQVAWREVARGDNAFVLLDLRREQIWEDEDFEYRLGGNIFAEGDGTVGEGWNEAKSRELLEKNAEILDLWDQAMKRPDLRIPESDITSNVGHLHAWRNLVWVVSERLRLLVHEGAIDGAFDEAVGQARFGFRIQNGQGNLITFLVGQGIKGIGLINIHRLLSVTDEVTLSPGRAKELIGELEKLRRRPESIRDTFKVEYQAISQRLVQLSSGEAIDLGMDSFLGGILLNPNDTRRLISDAYRVFVQNAGKLRKDQEGRGEEDEPEIPSSMVSIGPFEIPIPLRNLQGRMISGLMMPTISHVQIGVCKTEFLLSATQVVLALRAFQGTHGKLPDSLAELVPEYFPSIPRDPFDGEALRYSAEDKVVYSVGEDLEDAGGGEFEPDELTSIDENEPAVRISF